jgi:hypothetical protein
MISAATIELLVKAGVEGQALIDVVRQIEADTVKPRSNNAERQARYRAKKAEAVTSNATDNATEITEVEQKGFDKEKSPTPPKEITSKKGNTLMREGIKSDEELAFEAWNDLAAELDLSKAQVLSPERRKAIKSRLNECGGLTGWLDAMAKIRGSPFCTGDNDKGWKADLDFVLQRKSFTRLMEGSYDAKQGKRSKSGNSITNTLDALDAAVDDTIRRKGGLGEGGDDSDSEKLSRLWESAA